MSRFYFALAGAMTLALSAAGAPRALAFAVKAGVSSGSAASSGPVVSQKKVNLSPIVVHGQKVYLPVALQMVKKALRRPWSGDPKDADKLVCRFTAMTGSHFKTLHCQTNRQHFKEQDRTQLGFLNASEGGNLPTQLAGWFNQHIVNPGALRKLLKKLPPANASYTLQITDHGKTVAEYVFSNGNLVNIKKVKSKQ